MTRIVVSSGVLISALACLSACGGRVTFIQESYSPDGQFLAVPRWLEVQVRHVQTGIVDRTLSGGHESLVIAVQYTQDGARLVSGDKDGRLVVWDPRAGERVGTLEGHQGAIEHLAVRAGSPDLASASDDGTVKLWDTAAGKEVRTLRGHRKSVTFVGFSPDGKRLVSTSKDKSVKIWDADGGGEQATFAHEKPVRSAQFDPSGALLATGGYDGLIHLWDLSKGELKRTLEGASGPVLSISFSRDGRWLVARQFVHDPWTKRNGAPLGIWNAESGEHVVNDFAQEVRLAPKDWPYKAIMQEVIRDHRHLSN